MGNACGQKERFALLNSERLPVADADSGDSVIDDLKQMVFARFGKTPFWSTDAVSRFFYIKIVTDVVRIIEDPEAQIFIFGRFHAVSI